MIIIASRFPDVEELNDTDCASRGVCLLQRFGQDSSEYGLSLTE